MHEKFMKLREGTVLTQEMASPCFISVLHD
jgi:hypothetical protein